MRFASLVRGAMLLVMIAACHRKVDFGSQPQLLGKFQAIDLGMSEVEMKSLVPELAETKSPEPTTIEYGAYFDRKHQLERVVMYVARPIDDLLAAWGPGEPGSFGARPARIYTDSQKHIRFAVSLSSDAPTGNSIVVVAAPMRPLAEILDDGPDTKLFGVEVVYGGLEHVRAELAKQAVPTAPWSIDPELARYVHDEIVEGVGHPNTEYGGFTLQLTAHEGSHGIKRVKLEFEVGEDDRAERVLLDLFAHKWGAPTRDGSTLTYPVKDHVITVVLGVYAELTIAELKRPD